MEDLLGGISHAFTIVDGLIFDSNENFALEFSEENINRCLSTLDQPCKAVRVNRGLYFDHLKYRMSVPYLTLMTLETYFNCLRMTDHAKVAHKGLSFVDKKNENMHRFPTKVLRQVVYKCLQHSREKPMHIPNGNSVKSRGNCYFPTYFSGLLFSNIFFAIYHPPSPLYSSTFLCDPIP